MKLTLIIKSCWLAISLLCLCGGILGVIAGNPLHCLTVAVSIYFAYCLFSDDEGGESIKQLLARKFNTHK